MQIVTGYEGTPHVTAWQDRDLNQGIFGSGTYILSVGSKMAASIISNNEIRIADGAVVMQGCLGVIQKGTYDTIAIDNGSQGLARHDLICAQYSKNGSTGVESMSLVVIKGTAAATATDPSYTSGDIQNGDTLVQVPLYRVVLSGLTVTSVEALIDTIDSIASGMTQTVSGTISLPKQDGTGTNKTLVYSVSIPAGVYIASISLIDPNEALSNFRCGIAANNRTFYNEDKSVGTMTANVGVTAFFSIDSTQTLYFHASQNSVTTASNIDYNIAYKKVG